MTRRGHGVLDSPWDEAEGGEISFAPVTTDHKNTGKRKEEMKTTRGGRISATPGMTEDGGVREKGVGREMGGIPGI